MWLLQEGAQTSGQLSGRSAGSLVNLPVSGVWNRHRRIASPVGSSLTTVGLPHSQSGPSSFSRQGWGTSHSSSSGPRPEGVGSIRTGRSGCLLVPGRICRRTDGSVRIRLGLRLGHRHYSHPFTVARLRSIAGETRLMSAPEIMSILMADQSSRNWANDRQSVTRAEHTRHGSDLNTGSSC